MKHHIGQKGLTLFIKNRIVCLYFHSTEANPGFRGQIGFVDSSKGQRRLKDHN